MYNRKQAITLLQQKYLAFYSEFTPADDDEAKDAVDRLDDWIIDAIIEASMGSIHTLPKHHDPVVKNSFE